jgi:flagellar FliL protein
VAEDENKTESNENSGEGKSKKKLIIIVAIIAVIAIAASVGVTLFLLGDDKPSEVAGEVAGEAVEDVVEPLAPVSYSSINPPFLVTFNVEGRQRYMQISVTVSSRDASSLDALEHHMPFIRSKVISAYSGLDFAVVQSDEGKEALRLQTVDVINGVLEGEGATGIENIFFTNFVLQ